MNLKYSICQRMVIHLSNFQIRMYALAAAFVCCNTINEIKQNILFIAIYFCLRKCICGTKTFLFFSELEKYHIFVGLRLTDNQIKGCRWFYYFKMFHSCRQSFGKYFSIACWFGLIISTWILLKKNAKKITTTNFAE